MDSVGVGVAVFGGIFTTVVIALTIALCTWYRKCGKCTKDYCFSSAFAPAYANQMNCTGGVFAKYPPRPFTTYQPHALPRRTKKPRVINDVRDVATTMHDEHPIQPTYPVLPTAPVDAAFNSYYQTIPRTRPPSYSGIFSETMSIEKAPESVTTTVVTDDTMLSLDDSPDMSVMEATVSNNVPQSPTFSLK